VLHGQTCNYLIARCTQNQDQGIRRRIEHMMEHIEALAVGKREVKQYHIDTLPVQMFECIVEPHHPFDMKCVYSRGVVSRARERVLNLSGVGGIVLDEGHGDPEIVHGMSVRWGMREPSPFLPGDGHKYLLHRGGMSRDRRHANALVVTAIVVIVAAVIVLVSVMIVTVHVTRVIVLAPPVTIVTVHVITVIILIPVVVFIVFVTRIIPALTM